MIVQFTQGMKQDINRRTGMLAGDKINTLTFILSPATNDSQSPSVK